VTSLPLPADWPHPTLVAENAIYLGRPNTAAGTGQLETWALNDTGKLVQLGSMALGSAPSSFALLGNLLAAQVNTTAALFDATTPAALVLVGKGQPQGCLGLNLNQADGNIFQGLWSPLGDYGLFHAPVTP